MNRRINHFKSWLVESRNIRFKGISLSFIRMTVDRMNELCLSWWDYLACHRIPSLGRRWCSMIWSWLLLVSENKWENGRIDSWWTSDSSMISVWFRLETGLESGKIGKITRIIWRIHRWQDIFHIRNGNTIHQSMSHPQITDLQLMEYPIGIMEHDHRFASHVRITWTLVTHDSEDDLNIMRISYHRPNYPISK